MKKHIEQKKKLITKHLNADDLNLEMNALFSIQIQTNIVRFLKRISVMSNYSNRNDNNFNLK